MKSLFLQKDGRNLIRGISKSKTALPTLSARCRTPQAIGEVRQNLNPPLRLLMVCIGKQFQISLDDNSQH